MYPVVIVPHPQEPNQVAVGLTDGSVKIIEPLEPQGDYGILNTIEQPQSQGDNGILNSKYFILFNILYGHRPI